MNIISNWHAVFDDSTRSAPATEADLSQLEEDLRRPLSKSEVEEILAAQKNPWPVTDPHHASWQPLDPRPWVMPAKPLPASLLSFLRWSNGGPAQRGEREFGFLGSGEYREYLLAYEVPEYMPLAIPLGLDGAGNFALLDVRRPMVDGEYPVVAVAAGNLGFDEAVAVGATFEEFCLSTERIDDIVCGSYGAV